MSKDNGTIKEHVHIPDMAEDVFEVAEDVLEAVRKGASKAKRAIKSRQHTPWWQKPKFYVPAAIAIAATIANFGRR